MSDKKQNGFWRMDRRTFLKNMGAAGIAAAFVPGCFRPEEDKTGPVEQVSNETLSLYRSEFSFTRGDSSGYSLHCVNCKGNCAWQTFEKSGRIVREEQVAGYPQISPGIPDANPRGCNKGALHSQSLYDGDRLLYPMKRTGARGEGKWKRISWDEATREIAEKIVDMLSRGEFDNLMVYAGTGILSPARRAAALRLGSLLGATRFNVASAVGDMFPGATITYGISTVGCSSEAWYEADYLLIWGMNPTVTRIPDAHYIWEGKYRGSRVVTLSPDYNPTARQSSLWIPIKPGADSFFGMSVINVIIREGLYDAEFVREQTDLPFLVKLSDGKLLRKSDMLRGGDEQIFYFFDEKTSRPVEARGSMGSKEPTLRLGGTRPALEGVFRVRNSVGEEIEVTTVFEMIKKESAKFPPEHTRKYTGIHPDIVYSEARRFAAARTAIIMLGYRIHKYFWGTLTCRTATLMLALTGHAGRRGGLDIDNEWELGNFSALSSPKPARFGSGFLGEWMDGRMWRSFLSHYDDRELKDRTGLDKKELMALIDAGMKKEGFPYFDRPRLLILFHDNKFERNNAQKQTQKAVLDSVELYVNVNYRMDSSAVLADIVLPSLTNYEAWELRADPGYARFANAMIPPDGLKPPGEAKSEWEIALLLTEKIQEVAKKRGVSKVPDPEYNVTRDLDTIHEDFITVGDKIINNGKDLLEWVLEASKANTGDADIDSLRESGFVQLKTSAGQTSPLYPDKPFYPFEPQVYLKRPYFTLSGRQQFYVDHAIYLRLGCAVPTARRPVRPGRYPLAYYNPHTRYGIHTTWRAGKYHLRLQRGVPCAYINPETARKRGIRDGDNIRIFNDVGEMYLMAKLHPGTPQDVVWTEHAWENFQFRDSKGFNNVVAGIITPLELAGNYGHMSFNPFWDGNQIMSEASVDIERV
ncbi:MAG: molybdopterin-dependent oxidoreductase [Deferribacteres bacterium]|nr:molybdopterin-dependent oxidoreductase [Deferribacteres bacterium]